MAARRGPATRGKSEPQGQLAATTTSFGCSAGLSFMDVTKPQLFGVMSFISEMNAQPWLSAGFASHRREELELRQVRHASLGQVEIQESDLLLSLSRSVIRIGVIRFEVGFVRIFFVDLGPAAPELSGCSLFSDDSSVCSPSRRPSFNSSAAAVVRAGRRHGL